MAKKEATKEEPVQNTIVLESMPGADKAEETESVDMNFGLGDEESVDAAEPDTQDSSEAVEETTAETEDVADEDTNIEEEAGDEGEGEAEPEPAELEPAELEAEEAEPVEEKPKKPMVPKSRLDEVLAKQKALQKQLDDYKAQQEPAADAPEDYDYAQKELDYQQLVLDGEAQQAAELRQEMRKAEREQMAYEMRQEMNQTVSQNQQEMALATAAKAMEEAYPVFDQNSEAYDADQTQEVVELRDAFIVNGFQAVDALEKAVNFVAKSHDIVPIGDDTPALAKPEAPAKSNVEQLDKKRRTVSKKLQAAESQPPEMPGEGSSVRGEQNIDINTLTQTEFDALPDATLQRLRGDIL